MLKIKRVKLKHINIKFVPDGSQGLLSMVVEGPPGQMGMRAAEKHGFLDSEETEARKP